MPRATDALIGEFIPLRHTQQTHSNQISSALCVDLHFPFQNWVLLIWDCNYEDLIALVGDLVSFCDASTNFNIRVFEVRAPRNHAGVGLWLLFTDFLCL